MSLADSVEALGGALRASRASGIKRTNILYWLQQGKAPPWRKGEVERLRILARKAQEAKKRRKGQT